MKKLSDGSTFVENMEGYDELAKAIVLQAAMDYKSALLWLKWNPNAYDWKKEKKEITDFFHSAWCKKLTEIDPELIMTEMESQAEKEWPDFCERMKTLAQKHQKAKNQTKQA